MSDRRPVCPRCLNKRTIRVAGLLDACPVCACEAEDAYQLRPLPDRPAGRPSPWAVLAARKETA